MWPRTQSELLGIATMHAEGDSIFFPGVTQQNLQHAGRETFYVSSHPGKDRVLEITREGIGEQRDLEVFMVDDHRARIAVDPTTGKSYTLL